MTPLLAAALAATAAAAPSLILQGGKIYVAPGRYVEAVAVEDGRILAAGTNKAIAPLKAKGTRVIDLKGRAVTPGFHDGHTHFMKGSLTLVLADVGGSATLADAQKKASDWAEANPKAAWVLGRGWDHTAWGDRLPAREDLDAAVSKRPAILTHTDGHILWLNTEALKRAGLFGKKKIPGAEVHRRPDGTPTGIVEKAGSALLAGVEPDPDAGMLKLALEKGLDLARASGVTSVQGALDVAPDAQLKVWKELQAEGKVSLRFFMWAKLEDKTPAREALRTSLRDLKGFELVGAKGFVDGIISNRSAALLEPYADDPKAVGELKYSTETLRSEVRRATAQGLQAVLHAIGDRAVRQALEACTEPYGSPKTPALPVPCKIEHIELVSPADIPRFKVLNVAASMQPSHMTYDLEEQNYNPARLGARERWMFAWRSFEKAGAIVSFGTDWPVMPLHPRVNLFAATTRLHFDGKPAGGWVPEERVTLESAVADYTLGPAKAVGRDAELGTLETGKRADLVVWDRDLFAASGLDLLKAEVDATVFDGRVVFERKLP